MALILLKQRYIDQVLTGRKSSTIRPWTHCRVMVGGPISFNGRLRATCTAIERTHLADLSLSDIQADGFDSREEFLTAFHSLYPAATSDTPVWVIRFAIPPRTDPGLRSPNPPLPFCE
jgi:hypothetical protein